MRIHMADDEKAYFVSFLTSSSAYVEFGCGGSAVLAASVVRGRLLALDSSQPWLDQVAAACAAADGLIQPVLILADIGPIGE